MVAFAELVEWLELGPQARNVEPRDTPGAGRGLFARADIPASTPLFTIPARALLNSRSLAPHYPPGLNAIQLIALHLCLYRPLHPSHSLDPLFGPYISTLPHEFDSHPLTSHVKAADARELPPSVATALAGLHARYLHDWTTVRGYVVGPCLLLHFSSHTPASEKIYVACRSRSFVWIERMILSRQTSFGHGSTASLSQATRPFANQTAVNTRCIYHRLKGTRSHPDNLTLCPILDFANHAVTGPCMTPRLSDAERSNAPPIPKLGDPLTLLSPDTPTKAGDELYLTYGAHSNRTLFVEYGFVAACAPDDPRAEVDVQDLVEHLFQGKDGETKKKMLQDSGYWG